WLVNLAAKLNPQQKEVILSRVHFLLRGSLWPTRALIAERARLLKPSVELQNDFERIASSNLALMRTVNSSVETQNPAAIAVYGDEESFWGVPSSPATLSIDLGETYNIGKILLYLYPRGNRYYQYEILASPDNISFRKIVDRRNNTQNTKVEAEVFHFPTVKARYIKVNMLYNSANPGLHIREIKIFKAYENFARQAVIQSSKMSSASNKIIDGDCENRLLSFFQLNDFINLDLKRQVSASKFRVYLEHNGSLIHKFDIEVSIDGDNWEVLCDERKRQKYTPVGPIILNFPKQKFRYLRLKVLGTNTGASFKIRELEVL
ncbi:MAG: discoidin domain-containing protein, partial [Lentisphaeraceae bacterium]|nr:discoidin domain-containing protein [Lentisphaeraceae bacterium]